MDAQTLLGISQAKRGLGYWWHFGAAAVAPLPIFAEGATIVAFFTTVQAVCYISKTSDTAAVIGAVNLLNPNVLIGIFQTTGPSVFSVDIAANLQTWLAVGAATNIFVNVLVPST